jgi:molybdopterin molybdotransferase
MCPTAKPYRGCNTPNTESPDVLVSHLAQRLVSVDTETIAMADTVGRVLAQPIVADRDNPPVDVSAMDGYAVRLKDLSGEALPVGGEVPMGQAPPTLPPRTAVRIFTGGAVPAEADAVIRREFTDESPGQVRIHPNTADLKPGANIRRRGENTKAGQTVIEPGRAVTAAHTAALAAFGVQQVDVYRKVRVAIVVTGDELRQPDEDIQPTAIRDSNGPTLRAILAPLPWVQTISITHALDDRGALRLHLQERLSETDVLITTGGVSMGDHDHVPNVIKELGGEVIFHGLPIRPGRPMFGALGTSGQLILGLPGNPLSVMTTMTRFGLPLIYQLAGGSDQALCPTRVCVKNPDTHTHGLDWFRPVRLAKPGEVELVSSKGSGDVASLACSDGFIVQPAGSPVPTDALFWRWRH